jgi:trigger factor
MPEMEEAVIGLAAGGTRTTRLKFADDHRTEALRGKTGEATVTVKEVKEKVLPVLDDEFAKTMGPFETVEALKAELRKDLQGRRDRENRRALGDAVVETLLSTHDFQVPDALVLRQVGHQIEHTRERLRRQGVDPDKLPWDYGKLIPELKPASEQAVKRALLLEAIAEREVINPAEDEVDIEIERFAQAAQRPAPAVRRMMEKSGDLENLRGGLREKKTLDLLIEHAKVRP